MRSSGQWDLRWLLFKRTKHVFPESYTFPVQMKLHGELRVYVQVPAISQSSGLPYHIQQPVFFRSRASANMRHRPGFVIVKESKQQIRKGPAKSQSSQYTLKMFWNVSNTQQLFQKMTQNISHWHYSPSGPKPTSMKLSVSLRFLSES
jgi:hypothetical protein